MVCKIHRGLRICICLFLHVDRYLGSELIYLEVVVINVVTNIVQLGQSQLNFQDHHRALDVQEKQGVKLSYIVYNN